MFMILRALPCLAYVRLAALLCLFDVPPRQPIRAFTHALLAVHVRRQMSHFVQFNTTGPGLQHLHLPGELNIIYY